MKRTPSFLSLLLHARGELNCLRARDLPPTSVSARSIQCVRQTLRATEPPTIGSTRSQAQADAKSAGCMECHQGIEPMHARRAAMSCSVAPIATAAIPTPGLTQRTGARAPRHRSSGKPPRIRTNSNAWLNHESPEFIQFVNPAICAWRSKACGLCHGDIVHNVDHSMMNHGAMLWGAALYNNGAYPRKNYRFGQAYGADGAPLRLINPTPVTPEETRAPWHPAVPRSAARASISAAEQHPAHLRARRRKTIAARHPDPSRNPGQTRAPTFRTRPGHVEPHRPGFSRNLQKTRLHDPLLGFMGSNNHPGDYRSSGCTACHVVYANDRSPTQFRLVQQIRQPGFELQRPTNPIPQKRARPSDQAPIHARHSHEPMHELPHAPGKSLRESVSRLHLVGPGDATANSCIPKKQHDPTEQELVAVDTQTIPKPPPRAGCGAISISSKKSPN